MSKRLKIKTALLVAVVCVSMAVMAWLMSSMQSELTLEQYSEQMRQELDELPSLLENAQANVTQDTENFDAIYQSKAASVAFMATHDAGYEASNAKMLEYCDLLGVNNVLIVDRAGSIIAQATETRANFAYARFNQLRTTFDDGQPSEAVEVELPDENWLYRYYAARIDNNTMVVIEQDPTELRELTEVSGSTESVLKNITVGQSGYMFAVSAQGYVISYHPDTALNGADVVDAGIDVSVLEDGYFGWINLDGQALYAGVSEIDDVYYIAAVPQSDMTALRNLTVGIILFIFFAVMLLVILYGVFVLRDNERDGYNPANYIDVGPLHFCRAVGRKAAVFSFVGFLAIVGIAFYMQTLFALSSESVANNERVEEIEGTLERAADRASELTEQYSERYLSKAYVAAYILDANPSLKNRESLQELADALQIQYLFTFDGSGTMTATNSSYAHFSLSEDPEDQSYPFRRLLQGADSVVQEPMNDEISGTLRQYIGVPLHDETGEVEGLVQLGIRPTRLETLLETTDMDTVLANVKVGADGFAFAVSKDDNTIAYFPDSIVVGKDALDAGLTESQIRDGYCGYLTVGGTEYYASSGETENYYVYAAGSEGELMAERAPLTAATAVVAAICQLLIFLLLSFEPKMAPFASARGQFVGGASENEAREENAADERMIDVQMPSGRTVRTERASSRWIPKAFKWAEKTPEQKALSVMRWLLGFLVLVVCIAVVFKDRIFADNSLFAYILSGSWDYGLNIFAITAAIMFVCVATVVVTIVQWVLRLLASAMGARGETVCRLLSSFIKYATVIGMVYYTLLLIGIDGTTLLASAGILSIAVSLGAKELVGDILSGLFIIFEGEFRVGDIITVDSWRGTVVEIGVRSTKVDDGGGNVKIIRNSDMSNVVNMTKQLSYASCDVGIEYSESLERVENILSQELPFIRMRLDTITDGPFYKGVVALEDSSVVIRVVAQCKEGDRGQLEHDLNREMKLLFDKYEISMPFPQVVVNQPSVRKVATEAERRAADVFHEEQKIASADIGNEEDDEGNH